jgi:flagellar basal body-associated protein FliL
MKMKKLGLILGVLNTVAIAVVLGLFVYTKVVFKRPEITEAKERAKLTQTDGKSLSDQKHFMVQLDPVTVNLDPFTGEDGKQKIHYATLTMAVELRNENDLTKFNESKPVVMDRIIQNLGKKKFEDLNQVQGRYLFRSQVIDAANEYLGAPIVAEIYFSDFLLQ